MKFNIVNIDEYKGILPGAACGWQFEFRNEKTNKTKFADTFWQFAEPDKIYPCPEGLTEKEISESVLTGNVKFMGYAEILPIKNTDILKKIVPITSEDADHMIEIRDNK